MPQPRPCLTRLDYLRSEHQAVIGLAQCEGLSCRLTPCLALLRVHRQAFLVSACLPLELVPARELTHALDVLRHVASSFDSLALQECLVGHQYIVPRLPHS